MTYLKKIAEQIKRRYEGGHPSSDSELDPREIYLLICQVINRILKTEHLSTNIPFGEFIPPHSLIGNYTVTVEQINPDAEYGFVCTNFNTEGFINFWSLPNDVESWHVSEGDPWIYDNQEISMSVVAFVGDQFGITVSGFTLPEGETAASLETFLTGITEGKYLEITGPASTTPTVFLGKGISSITTTDTTFTFIYDFSSAATEVEDIRAKAATSHANLLRDGSAIYSEQTLIHLRSCEGVQATEATRGKITLPATPIVLPKNLGVWKIYNPNNPFAAYIPLGSGQYELFAGTTHTNMDSVFGALTVYEQLDHKTIIFNKQASELPQTLALQLLIIDPNSLGETDLLPIPADKEEEVIVRVLEILRATGQPDERVNQNEARQ